MNTFKEKKPVTRLQIKNLPPEATILVVFILIFIASSMGIKGFFTYNNLTNLIRQTSINGIVAIGMTFVIISAGIDLSVGAVAGLAGVVAAKMMSETGMVWIPIIVAIGVGALVGVLNAIIIYDGRVPAFIATLGTQTAVRGIIMLITNARMVSGLPKTFTAFAQETFLGLPVMFLVWLVVSVIGAVILKLTCFGRNIYAIGSNEEAARLSGINLRINIYKIYVLCAFMASIAGIVLTSRMANGVPTAGQGYEQDAIAAAVIGGASFNGGEGTIQGTIIGAMIMQTLRNAGNLLGLNPFILEIMVGVLLVVAVLVDQIKKRTD